ncbi:uncharacterized protein LOC122013897 [Zingiber officinale]|uniref:uncharacterized protein LOC122013897 n=1 Tax=Zingiber officinale TaxID=94328 RepID=UPI001C4C65C0|nr:uncharacterized protein LOC122013897 [Zingiber officinale]
MDIPTVSSETMMHAFTQGLIDEDFFRLLIRKPPRDYDHMLRKASEYINVEEAQAARRKEAPSEPSVHAERRPPTSHQPPRGPRAEVARPHQKTKPHAVQHVAAERPRPKGKVWTPIFCTFHQSATHNTRGCHGVPAVAQPTPRSYRLRSSSPELRYRRPSAERRGGIRRSPERRHQRQNDRAPASCGQVGHSAREEENRNNVALGEINIIAGGPTSGDSNRTRKTYPRRLEIHAVGCSQERTSGPEISFGPRDLEGIEVPHDDTLIIRAVIANYTIHRIFIDTGSSVSIIFKKTFDQLQIDRAELLPMTTPLYGFTGNEVQPISQIKVAISLGEEPLRRTRTTTFIVIDVSSSYNVILGRPALNEFRAVVSTFCQKIKFPVEDQVGEVKGDQLAARRCYVVMVKAEGKSARKAPRIEVNTITEKPPTSVYEKRRKCRYILADQRRRLS